MTDRPPAVARTGNEGAPFRRIVRFDGVQRFAHWANALLFGILILTAVPLYFPAAEALVGRRHLVAQVHVWSGVALPVPLLLSLLGPWGGRMRRDVRRINVWTRGEVEWLTSLGTRGPAVTDKFNPGQKLNAIFIGGSIMVMLATGCVMEWFGYFPLDWRTGATFVHDTLALLIVVVVVGHVVFALTHPESLRSMIRGWVSEGWAARHAPGWLAEQQGRSRAADANGEARAAGSSDEAHHEAEASSDADAAGVTGPVT